MLFRWIDGFCERYILLLGIIECMFNWVTGILVKIYLVLVGRFSWMDIIRLLKKLL